MRKYKTITRMVLTLRGKTGADPGKGRISTAPPPFWQLNHANSAYFGAIYQSISPNFDTRPPLCANPGSGPGSKVGTNLVVDTNKHLQTTQGMAYTLWWEHFSSGKIDLFKLSLSDKMQGVQKLLCDKHRTHCEACKNTIIVMLTHCRK